MDSRQRDRPQVVPRHAGIEALATPSACLADCEQGPLAGPPTDLPGSETFEQGLFASTTLPLVLCRPLPGTQPGSRGLPRPAVPVLPLLIPVAAVQKACLPLQPKATRST